MQTENPLVTRVKILNNEILAFERERDAISSRPRDRTAQAFDKMESDLKRVGREVEKRQAEAAKLRKEVATEMASRAAQREAVAAAEPVKLTSETPKLRKQIAECEKFLADLPDSKRPHVLPAARGDKKALEALDKVAASEQKARDTIALATAAIAEIETQNAEVQREFNERTADAAFSAAQGKGEDLAAIAHHIVLAERSLTALYGQYYECQRALRKTGASFDDARLNVLQSVEIRHRSAKAAGLATVYGISVRDAVPLEDATRTLLKLAIRRPDIIERKIA
jgi:FtsZ-binding cell division protein ZapB